MSHQVGNLFYTVPQNLKAFGVTLNCRTQVGNGALVDRVPRPVSGLAGRLFQIKDHAG